MTAVKERIIGAVSIVYGEIDFASEDFSAHNSNPGIKTDLIMLKEIENNPDCHEFISQEELMKELNM